MPQSQAAALPRQQEGEERGKTKRAQIKQKYEKHLDYLSFPKRGNRNAKSIEKHKNKITQKKT